LFAVTILRARIVAPTVLVVGAIVALGCGRIGFDLLSVTGEQTLDGGGILGAGSSSSGGGAGSSGGATGSPGGGADDGASPGEGAEGGAPGDDASLAPTAADAGGDSMVADAADADSSGAPCPDGAAPCAPSWWNTAWTYRRQIVLDNRSQATALASFPVAVQLSSSSFDYAKAQPAGQDLRFVASDDATVLPYEIEVFDSADASGASVIWVQVPSIPAASNAGFVWMYYGNAAAPEAQQPAQVWSNGFTRVWHFAGGAAVDSTGKSAAGTIVGATLAAGELGSALNFNGTTGHVDVGSASDVDNLFTAGATLSAWINPAGWGGGGFGRILDKSASVDAEDGWGWQLNDTGSDGPNEALRWERGFGTGKGGWETPADTVTLGTFQHVALSYVDTSTSNVPAIYINGALQATTTTDPPTGAPNDDSAEDMWIGNFSGDESRGFDGVLDEVRVEAEVRSADWVHAEYQFTVGGYVDVGAEQSL
jgi:hypothetical protein